MENKKNIKIIYQYDGSKFSGFQRQDNVKTVQGEIEKVIFKRFSEKVNMISAGRTDKGVHAKGQVSNFFINRNIPPEGIKNQINRHLHKEVKIIFADEVEDSFNARFDAKERTYLYVMKEKEAISPFEADYITGIKGKVDVKRFQEIMNDFIGRHDFKSFMKKDKAKRNTVREIYSIKCRYDLNEKNIKVEICGSSFLKTMVRIMIGSALAVYFGDEDEDYIKKKLKFPDPEGKKILAPSEGLYLYEVKYSEK
mgnify:FL=1